MTPASQWQKKVKHGKHCEKIRAVCFFYLSLATNSFKTLLEYHNGRIFQTMADISINIQL